MIGADSRYHGQCTSSKKVEEERCNAVKEFKTECGKNNSNDHRVTKKPVMTVALSYMKTLVLDQLQCIENRYSK